MIALIIPVLVLIGLYFIYSQISSLNSFVEKILDVLKNHIPELKENSENIINDFQQVYK